MNIFEEISFSMILINKGSHSGTIIYFFCSSSIIAICYLRVFRIKSRVDADEMEEAVRRREAVDNLRAALHIRASDGFFLPNEQVYG